MREALFFERQECQRVRCTLCPRLCKVAPGHRGAYGARIHGDGRFYMLVENRLKDSACPACRQPVAGVW